MLIIKNSILLYFGNPVILSIILFIAVFFFIPQIDKFTIKQVKQEVISDDEWLIYTDLNKNGNSEEIHVFSDFNARPSILIRSNKDQIIEQWNFHGTLLHNNPVFTGDYNNNYKEEVYVITLENDSVFLNFFEPLV